MTTSWKIKGGSRLTPKQRDARVAEIEEVPASLRSLWPTDNEPESIVAFQIAARDAWRETKEIRKTNPDQPELPAIAALNEWKRLGEPMPKAKATNRKGGGERTPRAPQLAANVRYTHDGKPVADTANRLSAVAWFYTKGISTVTPARVGVKELVDVLAKLGVDNPYVAGWSATLPNGVVLATVDETNGRVPQPERKAPEQGAKARRASRAPVVPIEANRATYTKVMANPDGVSLAEYTAALDYAKRTKAKRPQPRTAA